MSLAFIQIENSKKDIIVSIYDKNTGEIVVDNKKCNELDLIVLMNRYPAFMYQLEYKKQ